MPIYEFKCLECNDVFELLLMKSDASVKLRCPKCSGEELERVLSAAAYTVGGASGRKAKATSRSRSCAGGSCTTYEIPGAQR